MKCPRCGYEAERIFASIHKDRVLKRAFERNQKEISLWKDGQNKWHAAKGPRNVPNWAVEVEHIR